MKKYLIHFMSIDMPSVDDDGVTNGTNFGVYEKTFNTKEEAEKGLEKLMAEDKAELEGCYGIDDEPELADNYNFEIEDGNYERKELNVYDTHDGYLLNSTIYEIVEVEF